MSDAEVRCGGTTFKIHKAVVATRCKWFRKALLGPFEEGRTGVFVFDIAVFTADQMSFYLEYLYSGVVVMSWHVKSNDFYTCCIQFWKIADFFSNHKLLDLVLQARDSYVKSWTGQLYYVNQKDSRETDEELDKVLRAVRGLYNNDRSDVREVFGPGLLSILLRGYSFLANIPHSSRMLDEVPDFARDWAKTLTFGVGSVDHSILPPILPNNSNYCKHVPQYHGSEMNRVFFSNYRAHGKGQYLDLFCANCVPVSGWTGEQSVVPGGPLLKR